MHQMGGVSDEAGHSVPVPPEVTVPDERNGRELVQKTGMVVKVRAEQDVGKCHISISR